MARGKGKSATALPWRWPSSNLPTRNSRPPKRCCPTVTSGQLSSSRSIISLISTPRFIVRLRNPGSLLDFFNNAHLRRVLGRLLVHELAEDSEVVLGVSAIDGRLKKLAERIGHSPMDPAVFA
jgi:hypothetical protein